MSGQFCDHCVTIALTLVTLHLSQSDWENCKAVLAWAMECVHYEYNLCLHMWKVNSFITLHDTLRMLTSRFVVGRKANEETTKKIAHSRFYCQQSYIIMINPYNQKIKFVNIIWTYSVVFVILIFFIFIFFSFSPK